MVLAGRVGYSGHGAAVRSTSLIESATVSSFVQCPGKSQANPFSSSPACNYSFSISTYGDDDNDDRCVCHRSTFKLSST